MLKTISLITVLMAGLWSCRHVDSKGGGMLVNPVVVGQLGANCYIVSDGDSPDAVVIDPGDEPERIEAEIRRLGLKPRTVIFTHGHYDHICAAHEIAERHKIPVMMHGDDRPTFDRSKQKCVSWGHSPDDFPAEFKIVKHGDIISAGSLRLEVIHTPGHTPGSICLYGGKTVFTGDTLFKGAVGRTDLPGGNAKSLAESLKKLVQLPPETRVLCGHAEETTMGRELKINPYLNGTFTLNFSK